MYQFALTLALKDVARHKGGCELADTQLFGHLTLQGVGYTLPQIHMSTAGGVPLAGLYVFPFGALLQIQVAPAVEDMQMDHRMQNLGAVVGMTSGDGSKKLSAVVYNGKQFVTVVAHSWQVKVNISLNWPAMAVGSCLKMP